MRRKHTALTNTVILHEEHVEIVVRRRGKYKHSVLIDTADLEKVGRICVTNTGYARQSKRHGKTVASIVLGVDTAIAGPYIDHIDGNTLDNRKINLRVCSPSDNARNRRTFIRNNTGVVGIAYRRRGNYEYYRVSLTDKMGHRFSKNFNINKLGKQHAFKLAHECLRRKKQEFDYVL